MRIEKGMDTDGPRFTKRWARFLREVGTAVCGVSRESGKRTSTS
ncbi:MULTISPECIES: hypothetical protein [unclassified Streptomyces]|nr:MULTISPECIES: hypothetical protein [unclassified Streptomyces]MCX4885297.1 hypothetical protein [Streptomyces sp. NBC_00847]MCX5425162.1 hypothetical protein [Streptomyces sp. NBC_00078]